jgi:hypothetical protein
MQDTKLKWEAGDKELKEDTSNYMQQSQSTHNIVVRSWNIYISSASLTV